MSRSTMRRSARHAAWARPLGWAVLATLLASAGVHAADKPAAKPPAKQASFGKGKPEGPLLSRAQLRECLAQQGRVRTMSESAMKLQTTLEAEKGEISRLGVVLTDKLAALDRTSAEAVQAYNAEAAARDALIDAYNARTPGFNTQVDALQAEREAFTKNCENRNYDEEDEFAIRAGK